MPDEEKKPTEKIINVRRIKIVLQRLGSVQSMIFPLNDLYFVPSNPYLL